MTPGRAAGRRRRETASGRKRQLAALILVLIALAGGFLWLRSTAAFAVKNAILPVTAHTSEDKLRAALAPAIGRNLLQLPVAEIEERLRRLPYVKEAQVHRRFPNSLEVELEEYQPLARVLGQDGRSWSVSEEGRVLEPLQPQGSDLVLLTPAEPPALEPGAVVPEPLLSALPLAARLRDPGRSSNTWEVLGVVVSQTGEATLLLGSGSEVRLGETTQLDDKLMVAARIIEEYSKEGRELAYVDVFLPERPVAKEKVR